MILIFIPAIEFIDNDKILKNNNVAILLITFQTFVSDIKAFFLFVHIHFYEILYLKILFTLILVSAHIHIFLN